MKISIVIPAYNEENRLPASLHSVHSYLNATKLDAEIIVVIEKSDDRTLEIATSFASNDQRFIVIGNEVQMGKGYAVRTGMLRAKGEIAFFMDADLSTSLQEIDKFLAHFEKSPTTQLIIGSRAHLKSQITKSQNLFRKSLGRIFNSFVRAFGVSTIEDTQCGFKAFRQGASQTIFAKQKINGFSFDVEVLLLAQRLNLRTDVLPVEWHNSEESKVRILIDPIKMLRDLILVRRSVRRSLQSR